MNYHFAKQKRITQHDVNENFPIAHVNKDTFLSNYAIIQIHKEEN